MRHSCFRRPDPCRKGNITADTPELNLRTACRPEGVHLPSRGRGPLIKSKRDDHFEFPVVERIEQANDYFRTKLHTLLDAA